MAIIDPVQVPVGTREQWSVKKFFVSEQEAKFTSLRAAIKGRGYVPPGEYTELSRNGHIVMTDTPDEMRDHYEPVFKARGHILINGLGIGMLLAACLKKSEVTKATVIEIDSDVVALVGLAYVDPRVEIITADAFDYRPPKGCRYGMVWHDIWSDICGDNLSQMTRLKRKYGRRTEWQGCWCEWQCRRGR